MRTRGHLTGARPQQTEALPQQRPADGQVAALGAVLSKTTTVREVAGGLTPKSGGARIHPVELWIPRFRDRVRLTATSRLPRRRAELNYWARGRLSSMRKARNALGECIRLVGSRSVS